MSVALQLTIPEPTRAHLCLLELRLAVREHELSSVRQQLQELQARYLREIGGLYAQLLRLQRAVEDEEIRVGTRPPRPDDEGQGDAGHAGRADGPDGPMCAHDAAASDDLRRMFREIAKRVHPDLAVDDTTRFRRHSIMAEANRAYAERDEDRLRLLMRSWHPGLDRLALEADAGPARIQRRIAEVLTRLAELDLEAMDLRGSAIAQLKTKLDRTRAQGWDLFAEMVMQVKNEIARETARLMALQQQTAPAVKRVSTR